MLTGWVVKEEKLYWFEEGVQLGLEGDGQEIFDPDSEGWYWLDGSAAGAMASNKEVFLDSDGGKKVYYGEDGRRAGGEVIRDGLEYYYEPVTGAMVKGPVILSDGRKVFYDLETGAMVKGEYEINGKVYYFNEETGNKESETDLAADGSAESEAGAEADGSADTDVGAEGGLAIETDEGVRIGTETEADGSQKSTTGTEAAGSQESTAVTEAAGKPESTAVPESAENPESTAVTEAAESPESERNTEFWLLIDGESYWYVDWTRQGWKPELPDYEGEEIYDAVSDAWYWLDGRAQGRMASDKLVYLETQADEEGTIGKWVYYGADGRRLKGWSEDKMYYFDPVYGTRAKGTLIIGNTEYVFDEETGMKLSEKLIAGFEAFGLTCKAEAGKEYQYVTTAEKGVPVVGTAVFDYQTFVSDETHAGKEGYEWRQATVTIAFDSWWAQSFGAQYAVLYGLDYYNFKNVDVEEVPDDIPEEADEIESDGEKYQIFDSFEVLGSGWDENEVAHVTLRYECQVPVDYDGMVIAIYDAGNVGEGNKVLDRLDERSLLFRMK
ncbi:MAG TPA: hypothetical protein DCZ91_11390 [Lachnospiraceae bacterium]|nr:hypothetical protein [Lachnospiraceae bacterium]